jgi:cytochrome c oxidase subunit 4
MRSAVRTYELALLALLALTITTVLVAEIDLGAFNTVAALGIAAVKVSLVAWFFMHLRHETPIVRLVAASGLLWLVILLGLTFADYATRLQVFVP